MGIRCWSSASEKRASFLILKKEQMRIFWISSVIGFIFCSAWAITPSESHQFYILGKVKYRCYAGYNGKKVSDNLTKRPCDNKVYESVLIDKVVSIDIKDEPDPENSKEMAGSWGEKFDFKGRKFEIVLSLFKEPSPSLYRLRLVAEDNEAISRKTAVFSEMKSPKEMNPLSIDYRSAGRKEEISFWVEIKPSLQK